MDAKELMVRYNSVCREKAKIDQELRNMTADRDQWRKRARAYLAALESMVSPAAARRVGELNT